MTDKDCLNEIEALENKYGLLLFRMGLTYWADVGMRHLNDEYVRCSIEQIKAQGEADKAKGAVPVMTPEFQCEIVRCAGELAAFSIWQVFAYIKEHVNVK